jgi:hypothetical protein
MAIESNVSKKLYDPHKCFGRVYKTRPAFSLGSTRLVRRQTAQREPERPGRVHLQPPLPRPTV